MTGPAAQEARDDYLAAQIARLDAAGDRRDAELVAMREAMRAHVAEAVAEGIRAAVSDPALWESAGKAMRAQAQSAAGGWLLGGIGAVGRRLGWVLVIGGGIYLLGGWGALIAFVKAQGGATP